MTFHKFRSRFVAVQKLSKIKGNKEDLKVYPNNHFNMIIKKKQTIMFAGAEGQDDRV